MVSRSDGSSCPVCEGPTEFLGAVDFNRACSEIQGFRLPPSGQMIRYRACPACGFAFAPEMWAWPEAEFAERIYNADYVLVDPDYVADRPDSNADVVQAIFPEAAASARHLDYGGGNGRLSLRLSEGGMTSRSYDPLIDGAARRPAERFDLVTAFEVFEHVPSIDRLMHDLDALTDEAGVVLFSTQVSDTRIAQGQPLDWWYVAPRNGHISLYSRDSLKRLASQHGFGFASIDDNVHLFCRRQLPEWARKRIVQA